MSYNADGTLASESLPQIAGSHALNYTYDALGRRTGIQLDNGSDYTAEWMLRFSKSKFYENSQKSRALSANRV